MDFSNTDRGLVTVVSITGSVDALTAPALAEALQKQDHLLVEGDALGKAAVYFRPGKIVQASKRQPRKHPSAFPRPRFRRTLRTAATNGRRKPYRNYRAVFKDRFRRFNRKHKPTLTPLGKIACSQMEVMAASAPWSSRRRSATR